MEKVPFPRRKTEQPLLKPAYLLSYFYIHFVAFNFIPSFEFRLCLCMHVKCESKSNNIAKSDAARHETAKKSAFSRPKQAINGSHRIVCVRNGMAEQSHVFHIHFNGANYDCGFVCLRAQHGDERFLTLASFKNTNHHLNDVDAAITRANFSPGHIFMADT